MTQVRAMPSVVFTMDNPASFGPVRSESATSRQPVRPLESKLTLIIVRHGETALNAARVLQPADTPLSERGLAQADRVARRLAPLDISAILSSDLPRAVTTAEAIARARRVPLHTSDLLQERNFGSLRGLPIDSLGVDPLTMEDAPPDGESEPAFVRRVERAFARVLAFRAEAGGPVVVLTHGLVIRALLRHHLGMGADRLRSLHIGNTAVTIASADPPHPIALLNCVAHLSESHADDRRHLSGG